MKFSETVEGARRAEPHHEGGERGGMGERDWVPGSLCCGRSCSSEELLLSLFLLLRNRIVTETVGYNGEHIHKVLMGENVKMGEQVYSLPPQG